MNLLKQIIRAIYIESKSWFFFFENLNKIDSPWQTHQKKAKIEINKIKDKKYGYYMDSNEIKRKIREYLKNIFYQNLRIYKKRVIFFFFLTILLLKNSLIYYNPTSVSPSSPPPVSSLHIHYPWDPPFPSEKSMSPRNINQTWHSMLQ